MRRLVFCLFIFSCTVVRAQNWFTSYVPHGRDVNALYIQNPTDFFVAGGHLYNDSIQDVYSTDGINWNYILDIPGTRGMLLDIKFTDSLHAYACGYNGNVIKSTDGGQTWSLIPTPITGRNYRKMSFPAPLRGFAVGANGNDSVQTIIQTSDGGATWTTLIDQAGAGLNAITFINAGMGFAVGDRGTILSTIDSGQTWSSISSPVMADYTGISFTNATTGYIIGGNDTTRVILHTTDGGASWQVLKNERGTLLTDITFYHNKGYIVGNKSAYLTSIDSGMTWAYDTVGIFSDTLSLTSVRFYDNSFGVIGAKGGYAFVYSSSALPSAYTLGSSLIDSADVSLSMSVNTRGQTGQYSFYYSLDPAWATYLYTSPISITCDSAVIVDQFISNLVPDRFYYYYASASTISGTSTGDTLKFYTGIPYTTFLTEPASNITINSATINGELNKFIVPVTLYFDYGTTPGLGTTIAATPSSITDTLFHSVSAYLSGLQSGTVYYYRLRGHTASGDQLGDVSSFYTGSVYTVLSTMAATGVTDSVATMTGAIGGFISPVTLSFQYGTSPSLGYTTTSVMPAQVTDTGYHTVTGTLSTPDLQPNTLYFYRLVAQTALGTFYANTMTFFTGSLSTAFATLPATGVTSASADMNGAVDHFPGSVSLSFDYGTTQSFGNSIAGTPAVVNDTNYHTITAALTGLNPNTVYYYRLKGTYTGGTVYGNTKYLYTGNSDIPNWDFQLWYNDTVSLPYYWRLVSDHFAQVPGHTGSYAVRITGPTILLLGAIGNGPQGSGPAFYGGARLGARPDSLIAYLDYDFLPGDTGLILTYLYSGDTILANSFNPIWGSSGGAWARVAIAIPYQVPTGIADSVVLGFISADPVHSQSINLNSTDYITVDDVTFSPPPPAPLPNAGFEDWFTYGSERLIDWPNSLAYIGFDYATMTNSQMIKKAYFDPPYDFAAEVDNIIMDGKLLGGVLTTKPSIFTDHTADFPVFLNHQTLNGYYKFYPAGQDTMVIGIDMFKNGVQVGNGQFYATDTADSFLPFEAQIYYNPPSAVADSASINISPKSNSPRGLSRAIVDKLSFDGYVLGIAETSSRRDGEDIWFYPNPASTRITVEMAESAPDAVISLTDINGRVVKVLTNIGFGTILEVDVSDLSAGMYLLKMTTGSETKVKKIIISR